MSETISKKWHILFVASLVLNLFFVGLLVSVVVTGRHMHHGYDEAQGLPPIKSFVSPRHLMREASPEARDQMYEVARENWDELKPYLDKIHEHRRVVHEAMRAEPFDAEALQSAVSDLAEYERQAHVASGSTVIKMLNLLPVEERQRVIDDLIRHEIERGERREKRKSDGKFDRDMKDHRHESVSDDGKEASGD